MNRRTFLGGLVATAAGVLVPAAVAAEPERRVWALDGTMLDTEWFGVRYGEVQYELGWRPVSIESIQVENPHRFLRDQWIQIGSEKMQVIGPWAKGLMVARYPSGVMTVDRAPEGWS